MLDALHGLHFTEIIVFIIGAIIGILGFSKFLNYMLKHYEEVTMAFLIGVMLGTLDIPITLISNGITFDISGILPCVIAAVVAFVLIFVLETKFDYIE